MRPAILLLLLAALNLSVRAQAVSTWPDPTQEQSYTVHRASSADPTGANRDFRPLGSNETLTLFDVEGPAAITHLWITLGDYDRMALKRIVLRMYWDEESTPSVEAPLGDFFGLGLGECVSWQSQALTVGPTCGLNAYFIMPFARHARITLTNEGFQRQWGVYYNIDYRSYAAPLHKNTLYFHAQYRQAQPNTGLVPDWANNQDPRADLFTNTDGHANYTWLEATGHGNFVGVTMSVLQNQDNWWGEGDEMFFIDGDRQPTIQGTGSEDYFGGSHDFQKPFDYPLAGAPVVGPELAGSRSSVYRFHLESPIPFKKSFRATIEHGSGNSRSDNFYSVAYWYQAEPHAPFPPLPPARDRIPRLAAVGGPGGAVIQVPAASPPEKPTLPTDKTTPSAPALSPAQSPTSSTPPPEVF